MQWYHIGNIYIYIYMYIHIYIYIFIHVVSHPYIITSVY